MCFDSSGFTEAEEQYIAAVGRLLTAERESREVAETFDPLTEAVRAQFETKVEAITRETELVHEGVLRSVGEDSPEGVRAIEAATVMLQVEEAVANGVPRKEAMLRAVLLHEDPRTPSDSGDAFEGVSLGDL